MITSPTTTPVSYDNITNGTEGREGRRTTNNRNSDSDLDRRVSRQGKRNVLVRDSDSDSSISDSRPISPPRKIARRESPVEKVENGENKENQEHPKAQRKILSASKGENAPLAINCTLSVPLPKEKANETLPPTKEKANDAEPAKEEKNNPSESQKKVGFSLINDASNASNASTRSDSSVSNLSSTEDDFFPPKDVTNETNIERNARIDLVYKKLGKSQCDLEEARSDLKKAQKKLRRKGKECSVVRAKLISMTERISDLDSECHSLMGILGKVRAEKQRKKSQVVDLTRKNSKQRNRITDLEKELSDLKKENSQLVTDSKITREKIAAFVSRSCNEGKVLRDMFIQRKSDLIALSSLLQPQPATTGENLPLNASEAPMTSV